MTTDMLIFTAAMLTALATALGALPFAFTRTMSAKHVAWGNAVAVGFMVGASFTLLNESLALGKMSTVLGFAGGMLIVYLADKLMANKDRDTLLIESNKPGGFSRRALLLMAVMTLHSGAEGISIGVSFGDGQSLGFLVTFAMMLQNIPEGLAIALVLIPAGFTLRKTAWWCFFSSLPQPLLALPAYWAVLLFAPLLPWGLGLAAGAMLWICFSDLLAEAFANAEHKTITLLVMLALSITLMMQLLI